MKTRTSAQHDGRVLMHLPSFFRFLEEWNNVKELLLLHYTLHLFSLSDDILSGTMRCNPIDTTTLKSYSLAAGHPTLKTPIKAISVLLHGFYL